MCHWSVCPPTLFGARSVLRDPLLGFLLLLDGGHFGLVHLLQGVPLLPVVQQAVQHGGDLHVETTELLEAGGDERKSDHTESIELC